MKTFEDEDENFNGTKIDEKEGKWLDPVFESGKEFLDELNSGRGYSLG